MDLKDIKTIGIVGAGTMGSGIAQVFAEAGFCVYLFDSSLEKAMEGKTKIEKRFERAIEKKRDNREYVDKTTINSMNNILANIFPFTLKGLEYIKKMPQLFIEAVFEDLNTKQTVFRELDRLCDPETILATNTSSIPIREIAEAVSDERKGKIIGMHFMNPPYARKEIEIPVSIYTDTKTFKLIYEIALKIDRSLIVKCKDVPGFVANRVLMIAINEALRLTQEEVAAINDINALIKIGIGDAMGIFDLGDRIGWDIVMSILEVLHRHYGHRFEPPRLLHHLVQEGFLGKKTKKGGIFDFYNSRKEQK